MGVKEENRNLWAVRAPQGRSHRIPAKNGVNAFATA